jgi:hypothetical protein
LDADDQVIFRRGVRIKPVNPQRKPLQTHVPALQTQKLTGPRIGSATCVTDQVSLQRIARRVWPLAIEPHNKKEIKPWCLYHKLNTHSSCWALHPKLRPSSSKEKVAHSARTARVVPAKAGHSLNFKLRPTALSTEKTTQPDIIQTMDSYYAGEVFDRDANDLAGLFITTAGAATKERRSAETRGLRRVTQADLPLSFLSHSDVPAAMERPVPDPVPTPVVIVDELGPVTPRQLYRAPRVGKVYGGKDMISEDLLDATDPDHDPSDKSDSLEMLESLGIFLKAIQIFKDAEATADKTHYCDVGRDSLLVC